MNWIFSKLILAGMILGILALPAGAKEWEYKVGLYEGRVAVQGKKTDEIYTTQTRACTLPPKDRLLLEAGIFCDSREEVWEVLENFCS